MIHPRRASTVAAVLALASTVGACGSDGPDAPGDAAVATISDERTGDPSPDVDPATLDVEAAAAATVSVLAEGCGPRTRFGVGTVIADRAIVTVAHVVAGSDTVSVIGPAGRTIPVDVVVFDPDLDVAVLRADEPVGTPLTLPATVPAPGAGIVLLPRLAASIGDVGALEVDVVRRVTIRTTDIYRTDELERSGVEVVATIERGDSGAMVHTSNGSAGIIWARSSERSDRAWAVDLPDSVVGPSELADLVTPVDVQRCVD